MVTYFPRQFAKTALLLYVISMLVVTAAYSAYAMSLKFMVIGVMWVSLFFWGSAACTAKWHDVSRKGFIKRLFWTAFLLRVAWVIFSYYFYAAETGEPFEWMAADSIGAHDAAKWLATCDWSYVMHYLFGGTTVSDSGIQFYYTLIYKLFGPNIILLRLFKSLWGTLICVMIYQLAARSIDERVGRMAGIFCMFMPNLIMYCGLHLKETEMIFLISAFLNTADYVLRTRRYNVFTVLTPLLFAASLFFFRTVLGVVALFSFVTALLFMSVRVVGKKKRFMVTVWVTLAVIFLAGGTILNEVEGYWEMRYSNEQAKRDSQAAGGARWAKSATGTVMAPMIFILPFPTMTESGEQYQQELLHGGNYVRVFMGMFVWIGIFFAIFKKSWRNLSLIGSFAAGYLGIIAFSGYGNAERFLLPAAPLLMVMAAYGVSVLNARNYRFVHLWYWVVPIICIAWAFFKLGSRGLI